MRHYSIPGWKTAPFSRLLFPLGLGIITQWYAGLSLNFITAAIAATSISFFVLSAFSVSRKYKLRALQGIFLQLIICSIGFFIAWQKDIRNHPEWFGRQYNDSMHLLIRIDEPLVQKERTAKAGGFVEAIVTKNKVLKVRGRVFLYFSKEISLNYGDRILISKTLQPIKNTGNPGAFDYSRYAAFHQTFHSVFLEKNDLLVLAGAADPFWQFIYNAREYIVRVLRQNISNDKKTTGIAEALLIGYKEDLDKDLVQSYSNAGVVHIIAISGLHLGLIYFMLSWVLNRLPLVKKNSLLKVILILGSLWLFAIITGSSASVLRSAVMFSCILLGNTYFRNSSIYNSLASSAFILLCYDPFFLWDAGFLLSYLAVIGIVWLQQPVYRLFYIKNKWINKVWSMVSVTIAAQIAAFPLCIYYFHQFPNLFLFTNLFAVPLSTVILFAEIFLLCFSWIGIIATYTGKLISLLIEWMNYIISACDSLPWAVMDEIHATIITTCLMYMAVTGICSWLLYRKKGWLWLSIISLVLFLSIHVYAKAFSLRQHKIIIYNIARLQAIDIIKGNKYYYIGDSLSGTQFNFHIKPARIWLHAKESGLGSGLIKNRNIYHSGRFSLLIIDSSMAFTATDPKVPVTLLVISGNPSLKIAGIVSAISPSIIVFDASNSLWKIAEWKKECSALLLRFHSVPEKGAFVFDINQAVEGH